MLRVERLAKRQVYHSWGDQKPGDLAWERTTGGDGSGERSGERRFCGRTSSALILQSKSKDLL